MKLIRNSGNERVIDRLREWLAQGASIDLMSPIFSVHAFAEVRELGQFPWLDDARPGNIRHLDLIDERMAPATLLLVE